MRHSVDANSSVLSLRLKLAKLSAHRVFTESKFHTVGAAMVKAREATEVSTSGVVVEGGVQWKTGAFW